MDVDMLAHVSAKYQHSGSGHENNQAQQRQPRFTVDNLETGGASSQTCWESGGGGGSQK